MSGRMTLTTGDYDSVARELEAVATDEIREAFVARYNVAPSDRHWIVSQERGSRILGGATWGFLRDDDGLIVNARSENVERRPTYRVPFLRTRCVVIADGFYEWSGPRENRQPWWFHRPNRGLLLIAGLYVDVVDPDSGRPNRRFTVLTTEANEDVAPVRRRMPAIIPREQLDRWLGDGSEDELRTLLQPLANESLTVHAVSDHVNRPDHDDPSCIEAIPTPPKQGSLFDGF